LPFVGFARRGQRGQNVTVMKHAFPLIFLLVGFVANSPAQKPGEWTLNLSGECSISASLDVIDTGSGQWLALASKLQDTGNGLEGSLQSSSGTTVDLNLEAREEDGRTTLETNWKSSNDLPLTFVLLNLIFPAAEMDGGQISAEEGKILFAPILLGESARTSIPASNEFTIEIPDQKSLNFSSESEIGIQTILLGDNLYIRLFLTPQKDTDLPAEGSVSLQISQEG